MLGFWSGGARVRAPAIRRHVLTFSGHGGFTGVHGRDEIRVQSGRSGALLSPGRTVQYQGGPGFEGRSIAIERGTLEAHLLALSGHEPRDPIVFDPHFDLAAGPGATTLDLARIFRRELERPGASPLLLASLSEALLTSLLTSGRHSESALLERAPRSAGERQVRLAEELIDARASEPIRLAEVAQAAGVSIRSLQAAFRAHRGMTLSSFLRERRLSHARSTVRAEHGAPDDERIDAAARIALLSPRELEVCKGVARGMLNKQIAADLSISERTVKQHRARAMAKLGVTSAAEAARLFERVGE
ncbi:MAG: LuxR C-terminal-related transcriptional regulator [Polyangiaceae bacterium]